MRKYLSSSERDAADRDFFLRLRGELEQQIESYVYTIPGDAVGSPLSADEVRACLLSMRHCLVEPHWEKVNICNTSKETSSGLGMMRVCAVMAEDTGYVLVFEPIDEQYHLAWRGERGLGTWGIRGDAVECFLAR